MKRLAHVICGLFLLSGTERAESPPNASVLASDERRGGAGDLSSSQQAASHTPQECTVQEALKVSAEELLAQRPRLFRGVLTYHEPGHRMAFLQDATGAIYLQIKDAQPVSAGDRVEVVGIIDPGIDGPNIRGLKEDSSPAIRRIGVGSWPTPVIDTASRMMTGLGDSSWSRMEGEIADVEVVGDRVRLTVDEAPGLLIYLPGITRQPLAPGYLRGARVSISGVPAVWRLSTQPPVSQRALLVPSLEHVVMDSADRQERFTAPEVWLHDLRWTAENEQTRRTSRVRGVVTWVQPKRGFFLQRSSSSTWVQCTEPSAPALDQRVECVGIPGSYHGGGVLHDAIWRACTEPGLAPITPIASLAVEMMNDDQHGRLTTLEGTVVESFKTPAEEMVMLKRGEASFFAVLTRMSGSPGLPIIEQGSRLRVTGVCLNRPSPGLDLIPSEGRFQIQLRHAGDLATLSSPPYWNASRLTRLIAGLCFFSLLGAAWVIALKRRVSQQADVIRDQVSRRVVHDERVRIAREWHDTFEQHFAGLTMQLDAAATVLPAETLPRQLLERAAEMADHSRSEARQAIWDLRAPVPEADVTFLNELESSLLGSWPEGCLPRLEIAGDRGAKLPRHITAHLLRIAHEAVANAHKHAAASRIAVSWQETVENFELTIEDDGKGIPQEEIGNATARGHFGLLGLRERAHKLRASLRIHSPVASSSRGTIVALTLARSTLDHL
jgi:signal transduction histidine kinase